MRLIDSESIKEDSLMKQGIKTRLRLAMDRLAKTEPIWESQSAWNHGRPTDEGRYIVQYDDKLIEGFYYQGVLYGKKIAGKSMVRLVPDRVGGWVTWPREI